MNEVIEFFKGLFMNPQVSKVSIILTIVLGIMWYVYQTIADTNARQRSDKIRKTYIGQLITGKSAKKSNSNHQKEAKPKNNIKTHNGDEEVDSQIIHELRTYGTHIRELKNKTTSQGYDALDTYRDLYRILKHKEEMKKFLKTAKGNVQSKSISTFRIEVIDKNITIHSLTIPPITMSVDQAMSLTDIDSMRDIIDNNRILSAFAFY